MHFRFGSFCPESPEFGFLATPSLLLATGALRELIVESEVISFLEVSFLELEVLDELGTKISPAALVTGLLSCLPPDNGKVSVKSLSLCELPDNSAIHLQHAARWPENFCGQEHICSDRYHT